MKASHARTPSSIEALPPTPAARPTPPALRRRSYYATKDDDQAVENIRRKYGLSTESDAVRFALRLVGADDALKWNIVPRQTRRIIVRIKSRAEP
jgi:hypothetical protein